ncbi:alpha/beta hydrolase [Paenibacillus qinlingensis]|uniref:Acetyl esterase/lipase n=1 Tax=Paenibacillus qinlingensis TaxID=1837343 RepID=A0ABU1NWN8_9BACL|nr:alpha/beta hydrolase [Paenibacillus qinlingensis]MDR6551894.1 acetyl esterase/lipase [Paenibacillus qinlingensis]
MDAVFPYETLVYKEADGRRLRLFMCHPEDRYAADARPAVVWIHGGGWQGGHPEMLLRHCRLFAERGAVTFSIEYRLMPRDGHEAEPGQARSVETCIEDCRSAMRYIRIHAAELGIDPQRIAVVGDSAGGHLAVCLATIDRYDAPGEDASISAMANAVVNCNGIIDCTGRWKKVVPIVETGQSESDQVHAWLMRHEHAKALSPLHQVREGQPPMLIMHGLLDATVVPEDAVRFYEAYTAVGNEAELILYPHLAHAFVLFDYKTEELEVLKVIERIDQFLTYHDYLPMLAQ